MYKAILYAYLAYHSFHLVLLLMFQHKPVKQTV